MLQTICRQSAVRKWENVGNDGFPPIFHRNSAETDREVVFISQTKMGFRVDSITIHNHRKYIVVMVLQKKRSALKNFSVFILFFIFSDHSAAQKLGMPKT